MKKIFLIIFLAGICLSGAVYFWQTRSSQSLQAVEVSPERLMQRIERGDSFYVYFYSPACEDCIKSEPKLAQAVKNTSVEILRLDLRKHENIQVQLEVPGTPSIFFYREGKLVQGITGAYETVGEYERFFRETGGAK
ncbi:MAG: thioredoxin family protein [Bacillota bacterium]|nr:thioredoxin family protein [Clostridia bacterium]